MPTGITFSFRSKNVENFFLLEKCKPNSFLSRRMKKYLLSTKQDGQLDHYNQKVKNRFLLIDQKCNMSFLRSCRLKSPPYGQIECRTSASGSNKMETLLIKKGKFSIWGIFGLPQISPKIKNVLTLAPRSDLRFKNSHRFTLRVGDTNRYLSS